MQSTPNAVECSNRENRVRNMSPSKIKKSYTIAIYKLFQEYSMIDPPDLSPGSSPSDTNRTNRTRSSGGKYESALFLVPPLWFTNIISGRQMDGW